jgi:serine/threonine protein kinase
MLGKIIGNYKIEQKLGEGGMGAVYKGVDTMLDREVAIKALRPELASQTSVVERFRTEAVTLAKLHHPNIATLYALFRQGDELYMVLEFVRGETLDTILRRRGALSAEEVIPVFSQILDGINHAHELGVVHRDIKPANMMLTEKGFLKVLDFGIARLLGSARMTRSGNIIGTLEYMAPEQVKGQETDARSDIYALGMLLYEMLTGRTPFFSENEFELMRMQIEQTPVSPRQINPNIPKEIEAAILRAIEKDPEKRFQTAGEFREALLDAGFSAHGSMSRRAANSQEQRRQSFVNRQPTLEAAGEIKAQNQTPPNEFASQKAQEIQEIKETRFSGETAASAAAPFPTSKETRLAAGSSSSSSASAAAVSFDLANYSANAADSSPAQKSFFADLTWIHYTGASAIAIALLGLFVAAPLIFFSAGGATSNANLTNKTPANVKIENNQHAADSSENPSPSASVLPQAKNEANNSPTEINNSSNDDLPAIRTNSNAPPASGEIASKPVEGANSNTTTKRESSTSQTSSDRTASKSSTTTRKTNDEPPPSQKKNVKSSSAPPRQQPVQTRRNLNAMTDN